MLGALGVYALIANVLLYKLTRNNGNRLTSYWRTQSGNFFWDTMYWITSASKQILSALKHWKSAGQFGV